MLVSCRPLGTKAGKIDGQSFRFLSQSIEVYGRHFFVQTGVPEHDILTVLVLFRRYLWTFAVLMLLAASAVGYWMSRRALAPVDALTRTARSISGTNLSSRLEQLHTGDELQRLADTLNQMLARIETAFLRVSQFTADASHELRTPISLIRTEAEIALRKSRSETEYQEALRHILQEAERTSSLVEKLLSLARADAGGESLDIRRLDLGETVRQVALDWHGVMAAHRLQFTEHFTSAQSLHSRRQDSDVSALKYSARQCGQIHSSLRECRSQVGCKRRKSPNHGS